MNKTLLLAKTLFGRFFESELMPPGLPQVQLVIWAIVLLASPGLLLPVRFGGKYSGLYERHPELLQGAMHVDRLLFITLTMTALGVVALVIWDGIFPDRRDARILGGLPLPGRVPIAARLLALSALAALFLVGNNLIPSVVFGTIIGLFGGASSLFRGILAHFIATTMAGAFVFTTLVALQGCCLNLGSRRTSDRIALVLQVVFVMSLLQMIFVMPRMRAVLGDDLSSPWLLALPSAWFLGLYDVIGGKPVSGAWRLAGIASLASLASASLATTLLIGTHERLTRLAIESQEISRPRRRSITWFLDALTTRFAPHPISRAVFEFTLRTLARSRSHRLMLAAYLGVALALVMSAVLTTIVRTDQSALATPSVPILSAPFVIGFFLLIGARMGLAIPVEPRANWVFRIREPFDRIHAIAGVRSALLLVGVVPMVLIAVATAGYLWGVGVAVMHAIFCAFMGWLLVEVLLIRFGKLPFTCTYLPGKSRLNMLWPLYLQGFIAFSYTSAAVEVTLLGRPSSLAKVLIAIFAATAMLTIWRQRWLRDLAAFRFQEEDATAMFAGFHLSEGLASTPHDDRRLHWSQVDK